MIEYIKLTSIDVPVCIYAYIYTWNIFLNSAQIKLKNKAFF